MQPLKIPNNVPITDILGGKWTYCARCNKDTMVALGDNEGWECCMCGVKMKAVMQPAQGILNWSVALTKEEFMRQMEVLQRCLDAYIKKQQQPSWRVRLAFRLANAVVRPLRCKVQVMQNKEVKQ